MQSITIKNATDATIQVLKRDNKNYQPFLPSKILNALTKAWKDTWSISEVDPLSQQTLLLLTDAVIKRVQEQVSAGVTIGVEAIQNLVEDTLMDGGQHEVARHYILYRQQRAQLRNKRLRPDSTAVASYIHPTKYGRYLPGEMRRENYGESTQRVKSMHKAYFDRFPEVQPLIDEVFDKYVATKRLLPSMRSLQFGGKAQLAHHARSYNCCSTYVDRVRVFQEIFYLLLCGCGVGYSVQDHHVAKLPALARFDPDTARVVHHTIEDSIIGWADAAGALFTSVLEGYFVEFNYSQIREKGAPLVTSGGKAPGHRPLRMALEAVRTILYRALGRNLTPLECHDIICLLADAVLSGGIRRSALISLFSLHNQEMLGCKTGNWHKTHPWRQNANNSVMILRGSVEKHEFQAVFESIKQWGEPGFYFTDSLEFTTNPCCEISMYPFDEVTKTSGFSFCNLVEINAAKLTSREDFMEVADAAAILGTLQAAYTSFPYLGEATENIVRRDALLGVGMTGIMDSVTIATNPDFQREAAARVKVKNAQVARMIGIRAAKRTTCVKPAGTTSLALGGVGSGHHAHHGRRYIRRVTANDQEPTFKYFREHNPHMCVKKPNGDWVIEFPVEAPANAILKKDISAIQFLEMVKSTQINWVREGTVEGYGDLLLHHNVSNTVQVAPQEWEEVANCIWENRDYLTGVSLIASTGDKDYAFAPNEEIKTLGDEARWNNLIELYKPVDWDKMLEMEDGTTFTQDTACPSGGCEN